MPPVRIFLLALALARTAALGADTEAELAARAAALHARLFTIDTHLDTPTLSLRRPGWDITQRHEKQTDVSQCDFPRMVDGGLKAGVFAVFVNQGPRTPAGYAAVRDNALRSILRMHAVANRFPDQCGLALTAADGPRLMAGGKRALYLSIENGYAIGRDLTLLKTFHDLGVRIFGFVHNGNNAPATPRSPARAAPSGTASARSASGPRRNATASALSSTARTPPTRPCASSSPSRGRRSSLRTRRARPSAIIRET
jgi:membrane dipeptidase